MARAAALGRGLAGGGLVSIWSVTNALAYAGLLFAGLSAAGLQVGVSSVLLGLMVVSFLATFGSAGTGIAFSAFGSAAILHAAAVQAVDALLEAKGVPAGLTREGAVVLASGTMTVVAGVALAALGVARLGSLVRLLPNPVAVGFFAGLGAAFTAGGITLATGVAPHRDGIAAYAEPERLLQAGVALGIGLLLVILPRRTRHGAVMPAILVAAALACHAAMLLLGWTVADGQRAGWLLGPFPSGRILSFPPGESLALFDWDLVRTLLPYAASSALLCAITLALMVTGIEALTGRPMNVDREMRVAGFANIVGGALGGLPTGHALSATTFLARARPVGRWVTAVPGAVALAILLFGADVLALVPRPALAALLLSVGIEWMVIRTWREARVLPRHEVVILLVVAASIAIVGIVEGIALGLGLALLIFAWTYRRIPVIRSVVRGHEMRSSVARSARMVRVLEAEGHRILLVRLQGYMFFLNAEIVQRTFAGAKTDGVRFLVLDFGHVLGMDSSAIDVFARLEREARQRGVRIALTAVPDALDDRFAAHGVFRTPGCSRFTSADQGLEHAEELLLAEHGQPVHEERASLAAQLASLGDLPDVELRLAPFVGHVAFAPGETLMRQGQPADDMMFLESGRVSAVLLEKGAAPVHLRTLTPGTLVGELALVRGGNRTASVIAVTPCEAVRIDRAGLARLKAADPVLAFAMQRMIMLQISEKLVDNTRAVDLALR
ncbi:SLC26A/SulP transporter family protein [Neoroseomonas soli]|uniref:SLC26A/SulP transporter family protein n=1 Tax=Neoroseomonas soli TaxID=1081025 RepID=UPI001FE9664E|nr:SulP family inorganic anion transporter [Neoroseomonas soli]